MAGVKYKSFADITAEKLKEEKDKEEAEVIRKKYGEEAYKVVRLKQTAEKYGNTGRETALKQTVNFDTFQSDLSSMGKTIEGIYGGWQSPETMKRTKYSIGNMKKRINAYQEYRKLYGGDNMPDLTELSNGYKSILDGWDDLSESYAGYTSADEYKVAVTSEKDRAAFEKYTSGKEVSIEGLKEDKPIEGAEWHPAPKKSWWEETTDKVGDFFEDVFAGSNVQRTYDELTGFKSNRGGYTDDQLADIAIRALGKSNDADWQDYAMIDEAYARLSRSIKYEDSDLVAALREAKKSWGASPLKAAWKNVEAAIVGVGANLASFANSLGANKVPILRDATNSAVEAGQKVSLEAARYNKGKYGERLGGFTQGVVNLAPYLILGAGAGAGKVALNASKYAKYIKPIAENPSFWYSLTSMWGGKYQEALDGGASEEEALRNAVMYALPAALVEVGGGIGAPGNETKKLSLTILEEIGEEIAQDILSGAADKATTNPKLPIYSTTEDAVVNPFNLAETAIMTAPIVAVGGGAGKIANSFANKMMQKKETEKAVNHFRNEVINSVKVVSEYKNAVDENLIDFVQEAKNNTTDNKSAFKLNKINGRMAGDISELTGIDVKDFGNVIKANSIRHIIKDHGVNGETDSSMADDADIARIQYVIDNYDTMELLEDKSKEYRDKNQKPAPMVKISKRVNGRYYVVEAVPDTNRRELAVVTAYKKKATEQQTRDAISPHSDVRNASAGVALKEDVSHREATASNIDTMPTTSENVPSTKSSSNNIISQDKSIVNDSIRSNGENNLPLVQRLEAQSRNNEPIAVEDVKKATGFGEHGSKLIAELASSEGMTFSQAEKAVKTAYMAGFADVDSAKVDFVTDMQIDAFTAGKKDRAMQDLSAKERARNATVYDAGLNSDLNSDTNNDIMNTSNEDAGNNVSSDTLARVSNAIESSLRPEIKSNPELMNMLRERFGGDGITALARDIVLTYGDNGRLGEHKALFADGGEAIYEALSSGLDGITVGNTIERLNGDNNGGQHKNFDNNGRRGKFKSDPGTAETLPGTQGRPDDRRGAGEIRGRNDGVYQREIWVNGERVTFDEIPREEITAAVKRSIDFAAARNVDAHLVRNIVAEGNIRASGFNINDKEIYYNGNEQTFGHEMGHLIKRRNPAAFEKLSREIVDSIDNAVLKRMVNDYARAYKNAYGEENKVAAFEELVCDICGNIYAELEMLKGRVNITELKGAVNQYFDSILPSSESAETKATGDAVTERFDVAKYAKSSDAGGVKFALRDDARAEVRKVLSNKGYVGEVKLTDSSPAILVNQKGVKNLPMVMNATHIRENVFTEEEAKRKGLKVNPNINYHGLGEELFLNVIDDLDNVTEAYRGTKNADNPSRRENYFLLISQYTDKMGNIINVPVFVNEKARYNRIFIDTNKIATVFGRSGLREYIKKQLDEGNLVRIKNRSIRASEATSPINADYETDASIDRISQKNESVNSKDMQKSENVASGIKFSFEDSNTNLKENEESEIKIDNIRRIDSVSNRDRNSGRGRESYRQNIPDGTAKSSNKEVNSARDFSLGQKSEGSYRGSMGRLLEDPKAKNETSRSGTDGRRFLEALEANDDKTARELLNKRALECGYTPVNVYHGTNAEDVFTEFKNDGVNWVSTTEEYAEGYAENYSGESSYLFGKEDGVYDLYIKKEKILDVGNIDTLLNTPKDVQAFGGKIGFTEREILRCWNAGRKYETNKVWALTNTPEFAQIAKSYGYDTLRAVEGKNNVVTYGVLYPENLKSAKLRTFDDEGKIIPLEKRFDTATTNIRFSLSGENSDFWDEWLTLAKQYGTIPAGENPAREVSVPKKTSDKKNVSQTVRTILEAKATPDEALPSIEELVTKGEFSYDAYTDKDAIAEAEETIAKKGWETAKSDWYKSVGRGDVSKKNTAEGWVIYNNAVNSGETETALEVLNFMVKHQRSAAQALQATRILKKLSPETQLYGVQKSVTALQEELKDRYGKKAPNLEIDKDLAEQFLNARTTDERAAIEKEIYRDIGRQMPSRFIDKWNAWRYLAMLGNVRTHIRNVVGNAGFAPIVLAKNLTATAIESVVHRVSGKKTVRGKAIVYGSKTDRALLKAAWGDYSEVADLISNGGKYNDSANANQYIEEGRKIFKTKPLEWVRKGNSKALEIEDMWFAKPHYAYALAQYCKANNITAEQISRGRAIEPARAYAIKEAQKATYRDTNAFSQFVSELGRSGSKKNPVTKGASIALEGTLPFRKTPANILVRGVEYSPIGLLKGLTYDLVQVGKGKMSAAEAIDNISAGLTGTGILALGVYLAAQGLIRGHGEDDKDEKEFKELMGHQSYALELPNGQSITLDWLAPEALPFFVGVNIWEATKGSKEKANLSSILSAVSNISEPMLEMSCLQSLNDLFESVGYATSNDTSGLVSVLSSAATSYLTQAIPTIFGQAERTGEENRMTTYTEKNAFLTGDVQYTLGKASAKIPFWDYNQIPYIDAWGRKEASGAALKRGFNNFLNPAYTSEIEDGNMQKELLRLYERTGEGGVFPERADKYFTVDGVRKELAADEYVRYATLRGQKSYKLVSDLVKSKAYKKLSDGEKVKAIEEAYDYANQKAKKAVSAYTPDEWVEKADEFGSNVDNYILFRAEVSGAEQENGGKMSKSEVADIILDMAQNDAEAWAMYLSKYDAKKDLAISKAGVDGKEYMNVLQNIDKYDKPNKSGNLGTYTNDEIATAIKMTDGLTKRERAILWQEITGSTSTKNNPWRSYLP